MQPIDPADPDALSLDELRRIQRTLQRRAAASGAGRPWAVGFGPAADGSRGGLAAHLLVAGGDAVAPSPMARVRVQQRSQGGYRLLQLPTDTLLAAPPQPVGTTVHDGARQATSAAVVRWTNVTPPPADPTAAEPDDPRWRWGLLCVAHLFSGGRRGTVRIDRLDRCSSHQPATIEGHPVAVGRLPGGPDAALLETGLDRLWLSGLLPDPAAPPLQIATDNDLLDWLRHGAHGYVHQHQRRVPWRLQTYLPEQTIPGLGRLRHILRFTTDGTNAPRQPFGPGSSGSIIVAAGAPLAMQVASEAPHYQVGYAQLFQAIAPWLPRALGASRVCLARVF